MGQYLYKQYQYVLGIVINDKSEIVALEDKNLWVSISTDITIPKT